MKKFLGTVILLLVVGAFLAYRLGGWKAEGREPRPKGILPSSEAVPVVVTLAQKRRFERTLTLSGQVAAKETVLVSPKVDGTIEAIFVDEGDRVERGVTPLFQIDALKLQKNVEIAGQQHAVALCAVREKKANLERVQAEVKRARRDYERSKQLLAQGVIPRATFDAAESIFRQAAATERHAKVILELAQEQEKQAALTLEIAQKDLRDSLVLAPLSGVVSARFKEPGESGKIGTPVLAIQDPSVLEVSAFLPADVYTEIIPGTTSIRIRVGSLDLGNHTIEYRGPTIELPLRTFKIKTHILSPPAGMAPGIIANLTLVLESREGVGVPSEAILTRAGMPVLFVEENGKAHIKRIRLGLESEGWTEILPLTEGEPPLEEGTPVITKGQRFLEEGRAVTRTLSTPDRKESP